MAKRALGKGLGALIDIQEETKSEQEEVHNAIPIYLIDINQKQPRKKFDEEKMQELADSIKQHGIIQPLVLKPENGRYLIIAGERRYRAARMAGLKQVPAVLKEVSEQELLQLSIIENIQREDLNSLEEAEGIADLMREFSLSQEKVAEILGRSRSAVANSLRLLNLPEKVKNDLVNGRLSAGHARSLLAIKDKQLQEKTAKYIIEKQMSVRETENYIKDEYIVENNKNFQKYVIDDGQYVILIRKDNYVFYGIGHSKYKDELDNLVNMFEKDMKL